MSNRIKYMQVVKNEDDQKGMGVFVQNRGNKPDISVIFFPQDRETFEDARDRAQNYYNNFAA
jgi:hypothetical protein